LVGVLDLSHPEAEQPEDIAAALTGALKWASPERLIEAPDCGMKYLPRLWPARQP
jgi:5-methyltetrahydropteroyltriglutamate--homocysteine methyltransferase